METTQGKAVSAYTTISRIGQQQMLSFTAYKFFRLKKALAPVIEFQSEQETKKVEELGGKISGAGMILIENKDKRVAYNEWHKELENLPCEVGTEKISMRMKELPEMSVADMDSLDDFIDWEE